MSNLKPNEYRLNLGGSVIALHCTPEKFAPALAQWFQRPSSTEKAHINLDLELVPHKDSLDLPNTLLQTKSLTEDGHFDIADGLIRGHFDSEKQFGHIQAKGALTRGLLMRVMEQIFYQAYHSARQQSKINSVMLHSSAVVAAGSGFLFVGPSEAGKTTAANNSTAHHILGDEMNLVLSTPSGLLVEGTPFNGSFKIKRPGRAPLRAIFLLKQASAHGISTIDAAEAVTMIAAEVVPPVGLDQIPGPETVPQMVDLAAMIIEKVPVYRLELLPDPGFWKTINDFFSLDLNGFQ
ncbi:MAG: hypothetical protein GY780_04260 [bacterium]|nr:hypothetical protein [bacterium]